MSSTNSELGSRMTEAKTLRARLLFWSRVVLAFFALLALLLNYPLIGVVPLLALIALLVLPLQMPELPAPVMVAAEPMPLLEEVTRRLSTSLSIGQVANIVL